ncbi:MAG: hypothetical protein KGM17_10475 [Sphingomonadales bacterium]|nr:hypothetical protein [Sphingomonadales bacterium]
MPFGRLLAEPARLPTTHLYFVNAMAAQLGRWWRRAPIRSLGANCFVHGDAMVLIRRDKPRIIREALHWPGRLAYLIDDDVAAGMNSPYLPQDYRDRFARFEHDFHRPLLERADLVLTSSRALAQELRDHPAHGARRVRAEIRRIDPFWPSAPADQAHYRALAGGAPLRIVHLGSGSHQAALEAIAPQVAALLDRHPHAQFTYFAARPVDAMLEAHPRARRVETKTWPEYRRWLSRHRFHLALYPLMPDRFDRARSINKLIEHALVGAVGVYPEDWAPTAMIAGNAILAPSDPFAWGEALEDAVARQGALAEMAAGAATQLAARDYAGSQRRVWHEFLGLEAA